MFLDSHSCLWPGWASALGCVRSSGLQTSHKPAMVTAQEPGVTSRYLAILSCCQQKGLGCWTFPTGREGENLGPRPAGDKSVFPGLAQLPYSPKTKLSKPWKEYKGCKVSGHYGGGEWGGGAGMCRGREVTLTLGGKKY